MEITLSVNSVSTFCNSPADETLGTSLSVSGTSCTLVVEPPAGGWVDGDIVVFDLVCDYDESAYPLEWPGFGLEGMNIVGDVDGNWNVRSFDEDRAPMAPVWPAGGETVAARYNGSAFVLLRPDALTADDHTQE